MPLYFIPNKGQMDEQVAYYVEGRDKCLYFTDNGITFLLRKPVDKKAIASGSDSPIPDLQVKGVNSRPLRPSLDQTGETGAERWVVKLDFVDANKDVRPKSETETGAIISYFKEDPEKWHAGLPTYSRIIYPNLWPGIDLAYYGTVNRLKYEFIVHEGADPSKIRLAYRGAESVLVDKNGRLQVTTPLGGFSDDVPSAYQEVMGERRPVPLSYRLNAPGDLEGYSNSLAANSQGRERVYGFEVGDYDHSLPLILDPAVFIYCGFIGGSDADYGNGIVLDSMGNAYVTGYTGSSEATFPATVGPDLTFNGIYDAFVVKVNSSGTALSYCGYIGGSGNDAGIAIALDSAGNAYVTGYTDSTQATFPVTVGPDLTHNGYEDAFVVKLNAPGTALSYCGYIGGADADQGYGIAVDGAGNAYIIGDTYSTEASFPVTAGPDLTFNGGSLDTFVARVNAFGTGLVYCGYIGGSGLDPSCGIAVDSTGNAYLTGFTDSTEATFPVTAGPDTTYNGGTWDAYVAKVNSSGTALSYCGYIGGSGEDQGRGIAIDSSGNAYITGSTASTEVTFPVIVGPDLSYNGGTSDAYVAKVNSSGTALVYCGYIGGSGNEGTSGIATDYAGNAWVAGVTSSTEASFPVRGGPDVTFNGVLDAFVAKLNSSGTALVYCGYIGGSSTDRGCGVALDGSGNAYVTGRTNSSDAAFPVTGGPDLTYNGGDYDAFVAKVSDWDSWASKHAVGDFDGDGANEAAVDFGTAGIFLYNDAAWTQISSANPEGLIAADADGDHVDEIIVDLGAAGLWLWNAAVWSQLSGVNVESLAAGDVDADGTAEIIGDFAALGLWLYNPGLWTQLSGVDADYVTAANADGGAGDEIFGDFGATGLWVWNAGVWSILSGVNADYVMTGRQSGARFVLGDFGPLGLWMWSMPGLCTQLSGLDADFVIAANAAGGADDGIVGDFAAAGLWLWNSGVWTILSIVNADFITRADVDGSGTDEVVVDFGTFGLWLWNTGAWIQMSGVNPEYMMGGDFDGDDADEVMADFGSLGLWLWNGGVWSQISSNNAD